MNDNFMDDDLIVLGNVRMPEDALIFLLIEVLMGRTTGIDGAGLAENDRELFLRIRDIVTELNPEGYYYLDDPENHDAYAQEAWGIFWMIKAGEDSDAVTEFLSKYDEAYHTSPDEYQRRLEAAVMKLSQLKGGS